MDLSAQLVAHHKRLRSADTAKDAGQGGGAKQQPATTPPTPDALGEMVKVVQALEAATVDACSMVHKTVRATLRALDESTASVDLLEQLEKADENIKVVADRILSVASSVSDSPAFDTADRLQHFHFILLILRERCSHSRVAVALAKEELTRRTQIEKTHALSGVVKCPAGAHRRRTSGSRSTANNRFVKKDRSGCSTPAMEDSVTSRDDLMDAMGYSPEHHWAQESKMLFETLSSQAESALQVEQGVRQLSYLNSLMADRVMSQGDQLETLQKNTADSLSAVKGAEEELRKPLAITWTFKRILAVMLWALTMFLLVSNRIIG